MHTGTVKWFDVKKGFGFIINPEGKDVFVHFSSIQGDGFRTLKDGDQVEYDEIDSGKGLAARNVKRVKPAAATTAAAGAASAGLPTPSGDSSGMLH